MRLAAELRSRRTAVYHKRPQEALSPCRYSGIHPRGPKPPTHAQHANDRALIVTASLIELAAGAAGGAAALNLDFSKLDPCVKGSPDEIVVCGSTDRRSPYRLPKLTKQYDRKPLRAQGTIAGVPTRAHVESNVRPDGLVDKRIMITFSVPF